MEQPIIYVDENNECFFSINYFQSLLDNNIIKKLPNFQFKPPEWIRYKKEYKIIIENFLWSITLFLLNSFLIINNFKIDPFNTKSFIFYFYKNYKYSNDIDEFKILFQLLNHDYSQRIINYNDKIIIKNIYIPTINIRENNKILWKIHKEFFSDKDIKLLFMSIHNCFRAYNIYESEEKIYHIVLFLPFLSYLFCYNKILNWKKYINYLNKNLDTNINKNDLIKSGENFIKNIKNIVYEESWYETCNSYDDYKNIIIKIYSKEYFNYFSYNNKLYKNQKKFSINNI